MFPDEILNAATRSGALVSWHQELQGTLEEGEHIERRIWLRSEIAHKVCSRELGEQAFVVRAALRRFVTGGRLVLISVASAHEEVNEAGDIKELRGYIPPFVEFRFRPPKFHFRIFGRFVGRNALVCTTCAHKIPKGNIPGQRPLREREHAQRCSEIFRALGFDHDALPARIKECLTGARIL